MADNEHIMVGVGFFYWTTIDLKLKTSPEKTDKRNGIYGFKDGSKTFAIDTTGSVQLDEYIEYNAATGKVGFGSAVSLQWRGATYIDASGIFTGMFSGNTVKSYQY